MILLSVQRWRVRPSLRETSDASLQDPVPSATSLLPGTADDDITSMSQRLGGSRQMMMMMMMMGARAAKQIARGT